MPAVTITGPESTGKTTLARALAEALGTEWSAEGARLFVERRLAEGHSAAVRPEHLRPIARLQLEQELAAEARARAAGHTLVVRDTDLLSTWIYASHATRSGWLEAAVRERRAPLYLLCDTDIPYENDPVRTPGGGTRAARRWARDDFERWLRHFGCRYVWIRGDREQRLKAALSAVRRAGLAPRPNDVPDARAGADGGSDV